MQADFDQLFPTLNRTHATGTIKSQTRDFMVIEHHDMNFTGEGEHLWLKVEKENSNTGWAATQLASACKVPARQVGFAGKKDRHAITQQWFSVQLPKITDVELIAEKLTAELRILEHHWHQSKLKIGQLTHNEFQLVIRDVQGDQADIEDNIAAIKHVGVPNYFGSQRFGRDMSNIQQAKDWFTGTIKVNNKNLKGLLLSTARSHIFNAIVAQRLQNGIWSRPVDGDLLQLNGSHSWFPTDEATADELTQRLSAFDIHITAALWGEDPVQSRAECAQLEQSIADQFPEYQTGFASHRVKQDRRSMRVKPKSFQHQWQDANTLQLQFKLPPGSYATVVMREIMACRAANPSL